MSSMDQVHEEMREFLRQLKEFHTALERSSHELDQRHREADPLWQDAFRKQYDEQWVPLEAAVTGYRKKTSEQYQKFLEAKLRALQQYLGLKS